MSLNTAQFGYTSSQASPFHQTFGAYPPSQGYLGQSGLAGYGGYGGSYGGGYSGYGGYSYPGMGYYGYPVQASYAGQVGSAPNNLYAHIKG